MYEFVWKMYEFNILFLFSVLCTLRTKPFSFGFSCKSYAGKVEPFNWTLEYKNKKYVKCNARWGKLIEIRYVKTYIRIVTANHFAIGHLVAQAISGFVRVNWHIQHIAWVCCSRQAWLFLRVLNIGIFLWKIFQLVKHKDLEFFS